MIARLQLFYGGSPQDWVKIPLCLVRAYIKMIPRLRAEQALNNISEVMLGSGTMEHRAAQGALRDLQMEAQGESSEPRKLTEEERVQAIRSQGLFEVEVVPVA